MGHYILLLNWTDQGIKNVKDTPKRAAAFEEMVKKMGGESSIYYTLGQHDIVAILTLPNDEAVVKLNLEMGRLGNVRSTTLKGWTKQEMAGIISSLQG